MPETWHLVLGPQDETEEPLLELTWAGTWPEGDLKVSDRLGSRPRAAEFKTGGTGPLEALAHMTYSPPLTMESTVFDLRHGFSRWVSNDHWVSGDAASLTLPDGSRIAQARSLTAELSPDQAKKLVVAVLADHLSAKDFGDVESVPLWQDLAALRAGGDASLRHLLLTPLTATLYLDDDGNVLQETFAGVFSYANHTPYRFLLQVAHRGQGQN